MQKKFLPLFLVGTILFRYWMESGCRLYGRQVQTFKRNAAKSDLSIRCSAVLKVFQSPHLHAPLQAGLMQQIARWLFVNLYWKNRNKETKCIQVILKGKYIACEKQLLKKLITKMQCRKIVWIMRKHCSALPHKRSGLIWMMA